MSEPDRGPTFADLELNCPDCGVPPMDVDGFPKITVIEIGPVIFDVFACWSCYRPFAVGYPPEDATVDDLLPTEDGENLQYWDRGETDA